MAARSASYKQQKEDFVANLSGGPVAEIASVTSVAPVAVLLWSALQARQSFFRSRGLLTYAVDYALNVGAILLATTLYAKRPILLDLLLLAPAALVYVLPRDGTGRRKQQKPRVPGAAKGGGGGGGGGGVGSGRVDALPVKPFLSTYRGCMMVVTCVAILAVDFRLFPRRFAKVETWGTSLMDVGVGSFVFAGGIVAARPVLKERLAGRSMLLPARLLHAARHSLPLLVLGIVRLLSVKGLDYAEHVTEYGVHWNFFFTLGLIPPFVAASQAVLGFVRSRAVLALLIAAAYQVLLETTDLKAYMLTAPRLDLISKNREGLFSFAGYLAIFLAGQGLGMEILPRDVGGSGKSAEGSSPPLRSNLQHLRVMAAWAGVWTGLYWFSTSYAFGLGLTVSRRLANLPYVLWVAAFNSLQILAFACIDAFFFGSASGKPGEVDAGKEGEAVRWATSRVLRAFNQNGLAIFLLANLLTGLVNVTVPTLEATPVATMGILLVYTATLTGVAVWLDERTIAIKL